MDDCIYLKPIKKYYKIINGYNNILLLEKIPSWCTINQKMEIINSCNVLAFLSETLNDEKSVKKIIRTIKKGYNFYEYTIKERGKGHINDNFVFMVIKT